MVGWKQGKASGSLPGAKCWKESKRFCKPFDCTDHWRVMHYFLARRLSLLGRRPLDLLREGKAAKVIRPDISHLSDFVINLAKQRLSLVENLKY